MTALATWERPRLLRRGLWLEYLTVGWNIAEGSSRRWPVSWRVAQP